MPETTPTCTALPLVARGYQNCIVTFRGLTGSTEEWRDIGEFDFAPEAMLALAKDCAEFLSAAEALHPDGEAGLSGVIGYLDLGWHFFTTRQGVGLGYEGLVRGELGGRLNELAESFGKIEVGLSEGEVVFLN